MSNLKPQRFYGIVACGSALLTAGFAARNLWLGFVLVGCLLAASALANLIERVRFLARHSTAIFVFCWLAGFASAPLMNLRLQEFGFPAQASMATMLVGGVLGGSLAAWRKPYWQFQLVPSLALFGIVGSWNNLAWSPVSFGIFILAGCALLGISEARSLWRPMVTLGGALAPGLLLGPAVKSATLPIAEAARGLVPPLMRSPLRSAANPFPKVIDTTVGEGPLVLGNREVLRIETKAGQHLRSDAYDVFQNREWTKSKGQRGKFLDEVQPFTDSNGVANKRNWTGMKDPIMIQFQAETLPTDPEFFPLPGEPIWVVPRSHHFDKNRPDLVRFWGRCYLANPNCPPVRCPKELPPAWSPGAYNSFATARVATFAQEACKNARTDFEKATALCEAIARRCQYSTAVKAVPASEDPVDYFLMHSRVGYCDLFATSMVACARALNMPARYAVGLSPTRGEMDARGWRVLRELEFHAWAEVFFEDAGWVAFDPTEGADVWIPPKATKQALSGGRSVWPAFLGLCLTIMVFAILGWRHRSFKPERKAVIRFDRWVARICGQHRPPDQSPTEFVRRVGDLLGDQRETAIQAAMRVETALFGRPKQAAPAEDTK